MMTDVRAGVATAVRRGGRRGLLASAAALVGAGLAKLTGPARTEAAHDSGGTPDVIHAEVDNTTAATTFIRATLDASSTLAVGNGVSSAGFAVGSAISANSNRGDGTAAVSASHTASSGQCFGVAASTFSATQNASAVRGRALSTTGLATGVWGETISTATNATGVFGIAAADTGVTVGVWGRTVGAAANATGVFGEATAPSSATVGVWGRSVSTATGTTGIFGQATGATGATVGAWGRSESASSGAVGVLGETSAASGESIGVLGRSSSSIGTGVYARGGRYGLLAETNGASNVAVRARVNSGIGVFGSCEGSVGSGVYGESATGGNGVLGVSNQGSGVIGRGGQYGVLAETLVGSSVALRARTGTGLGVYGSSNDPNGAGVYGENLNGGYGLRGFSTGVGLYVQGSTRAAVFVGDVEIQGNLIRTGGAGAPDGAVRDGGGASASGRIVDDGRGRLVNGRGTVTLDPAFVAAADTSDYDVIPVPYGDCNGLFVASRTPTGFEVRELRGGTSTLELGYRVSARAKVGAPGRGTDLGPGNPGGGGGRPSGGPAVVAPAIPPAWREASPRPDAIPEDWRDAPTPPAPTRADDER